MKSFFFDTSALFKIYHREVGTEIVEKIYEDINNTIFLSQLSKLEFVSTLFKKMRENEISCGALELAVKKFDYDYENRFQVIKFYAALLDEAENLIKKHGKKKGLRTLDAIQLATFSEILDNKDCCFVCADKKLYNLSREIGFNVYPLFNL